MKPFRENHFFELISYFEDSGLPLDLAMRNYYRKHKSLGSKDRKEISETLYLLIRWKILIEHFCPKPITWSGRLKTLESTAWQEQMDDPEIEPHIRAGFPKRLFELIEKNYGREKSIEICRSLNHPSSLTIRANLLKTTRSELFDLLKRSFEIYPCAHAKTGLRFSKRIDCFSLEEFRNGLFEVQDEGSQIIADLVAAGPGDHILDYCAGSGGKSLAFAPSMDGKGQIYLFDIRKRALLEAKKRFKRAGVQNVQFLEGDKPKKSLKGKMDWILLDVPCSGTGTLRRNPDQKWKFTEEGFSELISKQREIFQNAYEYLAPNGKIVYATCSILPEENEQQIAYFKKNYGLVEASPSFSSLANIDEMDGFFGAVLCNQSV